LWDRYREYLKKLTTKSGQSASIKIPKWKSADEMFRGRDTVTDLEFDKKRRDRSTVSFSIKYVMNFLLFLAAVSVFL
jgi:hypothetical protein